MPFPYQVAEDGTPFADPAVVESPFTEVARHNAEAQAGIQQAPAPQTGAWPPGMAPAPQPDTSGLPDYLSQASSLVPAPGDEPTLPESPLAPIGQPDLHLDTRLPDANLGTVLSEGQPAQAILWEEGNLYLADEMPGDDLFWKVACKTGTLALSPGPGQIDVEKPLELTPSMFESFKEAFDERAFPHVTVPETHANSVLENTGYVRRLEIMGKDDPRLPEAVRTAHADDPDGTQLLMTGIEFTEPDVKQRAANGSIPDTSIGAKFNYRNKRTGKLYPAALEHVSLTPVPWVDGLAAFTQGAMLSQRPYDQADELPFGGVYTTVDLAMRVTMHGDDFDADQAATAIAALGPGDEWSYDYGVNVQRLTTVGDSDADGDETASEGPETYYLLRGDYDQPPVLYEDLEDLMPAVTAQVAICLERKARMKAREDAPVAIGYGQLPGETDLALADLTDKGRQKSAGKGHALPDGSFPIENVNDLRNAIQAVGRAKDPSKAKAHIRKRAKALGQEDLIPDGWNLSQDVTQDPEGGLAGPSPDGEVPLDLSTQGDDEMTVEEMMAQQTARIEQLEAENESLKGQVSLSQHTVGEISETSRIQGVNAKITALQGKVPPAVLRRAQALMLADKPGTVNGEGGLQLSVTVVEGGEGTDPTEKTVGNVTEALDFVLSAFPAEGVFSGAMHSQLHEGLALAQTEQRKEQDGKAAVDEWEREAHPERFDSEGKRIQEPVAA